ncbi:hypothetical protein K501DRAFT_273960 [Backusella circina FSU 941]|nr:hypothetical protein K501DRAFT_273960 [Backusella circina FSU 941]
MCVTPKEPQTSCKNPNGVMKIQRGGTHLFQRGEKFKIHVRGVVGIDVTEGSYSNVQLRLGIFPLPRMRQDTCEFLETYGIICPINKGSIDRKETINYQYNLPPGDINGTMDLYTQDGRFIACIKIEPV